MTWTAGPARWVLLCASLVVSLWLGSMSLSVNLDFACQARQWPGADFCRAAPKGAAQGGAGLEWDRLRERVAANPGDGLAMAGMARFAALPREALGIDGATMLDLVARVAPQRAEVLQQQAVRELARGDWARAVPALVQLSVRHGDAEAIRSLARLMVLASQDTDLLQALRTASASDVGWLDRALREIALEKLPMWPALPLVVEWIQRDAITPAAGLLVVRQLKAESRWLDAHAVWLQLWKRPLDMLYNGGFEREFVRDTFDWDVAVGEPGRAGAEVERIGLGQRGQVLRLRFNGRALRLPPLRHDLLLPAGAYHFEADSHSKDLSAGLVWVMRCAQGGRELARSVAMQGSGVEWSRTVMDLKVTTDCQAVTLSLQPQTESDGLAGLHGELLLDRIGLTRLGGLNLEPSR